MGVLALAGHLELGLVEDAADGVLAPLEVVLGLLHHGGGLGCRAIQVGLRVGGGLLAQLLGGAGGLVAQPAGLGALGVGIGLGLPAQLLGLGTDLAALSCKGRLGLPVEVGVVRVHLRDTLGEGGVAGPLVLGVPLHGGVVVEPRGFMQPLRLGARGIEQGSGLGARVGDRLLAGARRGLGQGGGVLGRLGHQGLGFAGGLLEGSPGLLALGGGDVVELLASACRAVASSRSRAACACACARVRSVSARIASACAWARSRIDWVCRVRSPTCWLRAPAVRGSAAAEGASGMGPSSHVSCHPQHETRKPRVWTWTGGSSGSRTSTASRARSRGSDGSRPTRSPATCSARSSRGGGRPTSSCPTAAASTSTWAATPSTPRPSATTCASSSSTTRRANASSRGSSPTRRSGWPRRASRARSTSSRTTPTPPATPTAATRTSSSAGLESSSSCPTC